MTSLGRRLDVFYNKVGERGFVLLIFCVGVFAHTFFALQMDMISVDPNEFGVAAWSALFTGKNWSGIMGGIEYYYGYLGALVYAPIMLVVKDPFVQYKVMLILNGIVVSFVPVFAYYISKQFGVEKAWQRSLVAIVCGLYSTVFAHTKFIWNEISCIIFPWLILYLILHTGEVKVTSKKHLFSILTAFVTAAAVAAHPRLLGVSISAVIIILFSNFLMKKKLVYLRSYFITLGASGVLFILITNLLKSVMWGEEHGELQNTFSSIWTTLTTWTEGGAVRFSKTLIGHLYYFATSTWGLGMLGVCLIIVVLVSYFRKRTTTEKSLYNNFFVLFAVYALSANVAAMLVSTLAKFNTSGFGQYQDTLIFGRYMDSVIPLLVMFAICYVFIYGLDLSKLLFTVLSLCVVFGMFFVFSAPVIVASKKTRVSPILGLYPVRIGERIDAIITQDGFFLTVSCVLCFMALFIVVVCCSKRYRAHILSLVMIAIMLYSSTYTAIVYLPFASAEASRVNQPVIEMSEHLFDSADAPPIYVYNVPRRTGTLLQFLNQNTKVYSTSSMRKIPEHCFIIVDHDNRLALRPQSDQVLFELAATDDYIIYAYGERAVAYARSQDTLAEGGLNAKNQ